MRLRLTLPSEVFAEARGLISMLKDNAAASPIITQKLRDGISALEGSGGNIAVLTGADGKVLIDAGIGVSRHQNTRALEDLGAGPARSLVHSAKAPETPRATSPSLREGFTMAHAGPHCATIRRRCGRER